VKLKRANAITCIYPLNPKTIFPGDAFYFLPENYRGNYRNSPNDNNPHEKQTGPSKADINTSHSLFCF
jgi:hypothetical protein